MEGYISLTRNGTRKVNVNIRGVMYVQHGMFNNERMKTEITYLDGKKIYVSEEPLEVDELIERELGISP